MENSKEIALLSRVGRVRPPSYLKSHVMERIAIEREQKVPTRSVLAMAATVAVLMLLNVWVLIGSVSGSKSGNSIGESLAIEMKINVTNQLYHD